MLPEGDHQFLEIDVKDYGWEWQEYDVESFLMRHYYKTDWSGHWNAAEFPFHML